MCILVNGLIMSYFMLTSSAVSSVKIHQPSCCTLWLIWRWHNSKIFVFPAQLRQHWKLTACKRATTTHPLSKSVTPKLKKSIFPLPFLALYWCLVPFPSVTRPSGWHWWSEQDVPSACRMLHCAALGDQPRFAPHAVVADPERGRVGGRPDADSHLHPPVNTSAAKTMLHLGKGTRGKGRTGSCCLWVHAAM